MDGGSIQRLVAVSNAKEACGQLEGVVAETRHVEKFAALAKGTGCIAMLNDGSPKVRPRHPGKEGADAVLSSTPMAFTASSTTVSEPRDRRPGRHYADIGRRQCSSARF